MDEDIASVGHHYATLFRTKLHTFRTLANVAESLSEHIEYLDIILRLPLLADEECHSCIPPEVSCLMILLIALIRIVLRTDKKSTLSLSGSEITLDHLKSVDKR